MYEVQDVIKYTKNIVCVNSINGGLITNYVTCASGCFCVMKVTPALLSFAFSTAQRKKKEDTEG